MKKFTITELQKLYSTNETCLEKLFQLKYGHTNNCNKDGWKLQGGVSLTFFRRTTKTGDFVSGYTWAQAVLKESIPV